jgi:hypothetical protein
VKKTAIHRHSPLPNLQAQISSMEISLRWSEQIGGEDSEVSRMRRATLESLMELQRIKTPEHIATQDQSSNKRIDRMWEHGLRELQRTGKLK